LLVIIICEVVSLRLNVGIGLVELFIGLHNGDFDLFQLNLLDEFQDPFSDLSLLLLDLHMFIEDFLDLVFFDNSFLLRQCLNERRNLFNVRLDQVDQVCLLIGLEFICLSDQLLNLFENLFILLNLVLLHDTHLLQLHRFFE